MAGGQRELGEKKKHATTSEDVCPAVLVQSRPTWPGCSLMGQHHAGWKKHIDWPGAQGSRAKGRVEERRGNTSRLKGRAHKFPPLLKEDLGATNIAKPQPTPEHACEAAQVRQGREQVVQQS